MRRRMGKESRQILFVFPTLIFIHLFSYFEFLINTNQSEWMKDIYKAIFCINSGVQAPQGQEKAEAVTGFLAFIFSFFL